jgi:hypothetical protein
MDSQLVFNHLPRDLGQIFPEKCDEREFLFGLELYAEAKLLIRVIGSMTTSLSATPFFLSSAAWSALG